MTLIDLDLPDGALGPSALRRCLVPLLALLAACPVESEEIGATLDDGGASDDATAGSTGDGTAGDGSATSAGDGTATSAGDDMGSGSVGSDDGMDSSDATGEGTCFEQWSSPVAIVEAASRPAANVPGMRLRFAYTPGVVTLTEILDEQIVQGSDGPFSPRTHSGSWVELRDAADTTLYTSLEFQVVPESMEALPGGPIVVCPEDGLLQLTNFPNDPAATQVVFFQEALDGELGGPTIEFLRFDLP